MGVSLIALLVVTVFGLAVFGAAIWGVVLLVAALRNRADRQGLPQEFPAAVCQGCAASLPQGTRVCPACGQQV